MAIILTMSYLYKAVKAVAIARKNVEEEAIDIMCKPEFTGSAILTTISPYT